MARLVIYGAGGFGREVYPIALAQTDDAVVFADDDHDGQIFGAEVIRPERIAADDVVFIAVGAPVIRRAIATRLHGCRFVSLHAASAVFGPEVRIGEGAAFSYFTVAAASIQVGAHFHCNGYSYLGHDVVVGDFVTLAPRVGVNGFVHIEDEVSIGAGAIIKNGTPGKPLVIGRGAIIGCGAVVTKDVEPGSVVIGNPARPIERRAHLVAA